MFSSTSNSPPHPSKVQMPPLGAWKRGGGVDVEALNWLAHKPLLVSVENSQNAKEQMYESIFIKN